VSHWARYQRGAVIEPEHTIQVRRVELHPVHSADNVAGVVDQNVDWPECDRLTGQAPGLIVEREVGADDGRPPAERFNLGPHTLRLVGAAVAMDDDIGAAPGKGARGGHADVTATPGDQRGAPLKLHTNRS
jgi:hypothetical protein